MIEVGNWIGLDRVVVIGIDDQIYRDRHQYGQNYRERSQFG